ncbi:hypothetical protein K8T06_10535 [bacterium]|nr:hypothetical protein [bacterium]
MADFWIGTPWDFNGISQTPNAGKIACGYFVTAVLHDAGFNIDRRKLAQQPSENIIKTMISDENRIHRFSHTSMEDFNSFMKDAADGVYIVGLDIHVGFIIKTKDETCFIHSSYYDPPLSVIKQALDEESPLKDSKYRVIGNILDDPEAIRMWLIQELFKTKVFTPSQR